MNKTLFFCCLFLFSFYLNTFSQKGFYFLKSNQVKQRISFKLINNLIVIPVEINEKKLSFILDSGVTKNIIFNLSEKDSIGLLNTEKVTSRGLGSGVAIDALLSKNNKMKIKGLVSFQETIYVILKDYFDLSSKMGVTIHGIIGYNVLKNFIVKINYRTKKIDFYNPNKYVYKKCKRCEILPLQFYRNKPFVDLKVQLDTIEEKKTEVKLLVDSGGSESIWLFEDSKKEIKTPKRFFRDILGEGLSGHIYGNRSRIPKLFIGKFEIKNPTTSFLDTVSTKNARGLRSRNGSIGGNILKRFKVWLDYPNRQVMLKKNANFNNEFYYNMSGLDVVYNGKELVREEVKTIDSYNNNANNRNTFSFTTNYSYKFKHSFIIRHIVPNSPAAKVGIKEGDLIVRLNGKPAHKYNLTNIIHKFQEKPNRKIRMTIKRKGINMDFQFRLEKRI
ncbi:MAG: aspartyl protease family protein [Polaribacter sp.]